MYTFHNFPLKMFWGLTFRQMATQSYFYALQGCSRLCLFIIHIGLSQSNGGLQLNVSEFVLCADFKISLQLRFGDNLGSLSTASEKVFSVPLVKRSAGMRQRFGECVSAAFVLLVNVIKHLDLLVLLNRLTMVAKRSNFLLLSFQFLFFQKEQEIIHLFSHTCPNVDC